jgi:plasmid maintenance system antidote protein VapI
MKNKKHSFTSDGSQKVPGGRTCAITADTALRLSRFFGNTPQFWMGLQSQYDLDIAQDQLGKRLEREVRPYAMAQ